MNNIEEKKRKYPPKVKIQTPKNFVLINPKKKKKKRRGEISQHVIVVDNKKHGVNRQFIFVVENKYYYCLHLF